MNYIKLKAWYFLKEVKTLTIDSIELFIKKRDYAIKYFKAGDEKVLKLCPDAIHEKGFVSKGNAIRVVYIYDEISVEEKIKTLVHEVGHILLDNDIDNNPFKEAKATMFSEYVFKALNNDKSKFTFWKLSTLIATILIVISTVFIGNKIYTKHTTEKINTINSVLADEEVQQKSDTVYITPTGKKFHTSDCRYINTSTAIAVAFEEIGKYNLTPCKVCKPNNN